MKQHEVNLIALFWLVVAHIVRYRLDTSYESMDYFGNCGAI
jgi:hypothetical protein